MTELITAIAVWCSQPSYMRSQAAQVEKCRAQLMECLFTKNNSPTANETKACFAKQKLE